MICGCPAGRPRLPSQDGSPLVYPELSARGSISPYIHRLHPVKLHFLLGVGNGTRMASGDASKGRRACLHPSTRGEDQLAGPPQATASIGPKPAGHPRGFNGSVTPAWCDPMRSGAGAACLRSGAALGSGHRQCAGPRRGGLRPGPVPRRAYRGEGGSAGPCGVPCPLVRGRQAHQPHACSPGRAAGHWARPPCPRRSPRRLGWRRPWSFRQRRRRTLPISKAPIVSTGNSIRERWCAPPVPPRRRDFCC
jgi:hypothetical protein